MARKTLRNIVVGIIIVLLLVFLVLTLSVDYIIKSGIERVGTEMTKTSVTVDEVSVSPFSGKGRVTGFKVENPEGYNAGHAVIIETFEISLDPTTLLSDEIITHDIIIRNAIIYVEQKLPENNLKTLMDRVEEAVATGTSSEATMIIDHFLLEKGTVDLYTEVGGKRSARVTLSKIELNDLGKDGSRAAVEQVVKTIAEHLVNEALQAALKGGSEQLEKEVREALEDIFN